MQTAGPLALATPQPYTNDTNVSNDSEVLANRELASSHRAIQDLLAHIHATSRLVSSPYHDLANQLDVSTLETASQLFALALTVLEPVRPDYATAPYLESFDWSSVFATLRSLCIASRHAWTARRFYVVVFRSKLQPTADRTRLGLLDQKSHEEACASGGLLKYWFGTPDVERRNLATCLWHAHEDAVAGGKGPWHAQARQAARTMYESIEFQTYWLHVDDGAATWTLEPFSRPSHTR